MDRRLLWAAVPAGALLGLSLASGGGRVTPSVIGLGQAPGLVPAVPVSAPVRFAEATAASGIFFTHSQGQRLEAITQTMAPGLCLLDADGDGDLDVYLVDGESRPNRLYRNRGDGSFEDMTLEAGVGHLGWGMGCSVADYDNDGDSDLYVTNYGANVLYRNRGDGVFEDVTAAAGVDHPGWGSSSAWADYDGDGDLDLYVANYLVFDPTFRPADPFLRYERDEPFTLLPHSYDGADNVLYRNEGDGHFTEVTAIAGVSNPGGRSLGVMWSDYDGDGDPDLYVANDVSRNVLSRNNGDGTFSDVSLASGVDDPRGGMGIAVGDVDADGDLDIFSTHWQTETNVLYVNLANELRMPSELLFGDDTALAGLAYPSIGVVGWGTALLDYDHDGDLDISVANGYTSPEAERPTQCVAQRPHLFRNRGGGAFDEIGSSVGLDMLLPGRGLAAGDLDLDGDLDLFLASNNGPAVVLRNEGGNRAGHWLQVRLRGIESNADGVGTRLELTVGGRVLIREATAGDSYLSQSSSYVHFGLGGNVRVERLRLRWPSGRVDDLRNLPADRFLLVKEGVGVAQELPSVHSRGSGSEP